MNADKRCETCLFVDRRSVMRVRKYNSADRRSYMETDLHTTDGWTTGASWNQEAGDELISRDAFVCMRYPQQIDVKADHRCGEYKPIAEEPV